MGLGDIIALLGAMNSRAGNAPAGFGAIIGFPAVIGGLVAVILGIIALTRVQTWQMVNGRRHAIIGIVSGAATFLLCCAIVALAGSSSGRSFSVLTAQRSTPQDNAAEKPAG